MIKNNIKSLLGHFICIAISFVICGILFGAAKWHSEEAAMAHEITVKRASYIVLIVAIVYYFLYGRLFLVKLKGTLKNIASVFSIFLLGLLIWLFAGTQVGFSKEAMQVNRWQICTYYSAYALPLINIKNISNPGSMLVFSVIPSLAMFLGIYTGKHHVKETNHY